MILSFPPLADNLKSYILNGERLSCQHATLSRQILCDVRRNHVKQILRRNSFISENKLSMFWVFSSKLPEIVFLNVL